MRLNYFVCTKRLGQRLTGPGQKIIFASLSGPDANRANHRARSRMVEHNILSTNAFCWIDGAYLPALATPSGDLSWWRHESQLFGASRQNRSLSFGVSCDVIMHLVQAFLIRFWREFSCEMLYEHLLRLCGNTRDSRVLWALLTLLRQSISLNFNSRLTRLMSEPQVAFRLCVLFSIILLEDTIPSFVKHLCTR